MERILRSGRWLVLHDDRHAAPSADWFDPDWWQARSLADQTLGGRGQALAVRTPLGPAVLRVYHRGGWVRHLSRSTYVWTGTDRTRPFAEWRVTRHLFDAGLPVPEPLAAGFRRSGLVYSGALLTRRIPDTEPLPVAARQMGSADWKRLGRVLGMAADAGLRHPDLNANNILFDADGKFWLLDFDRARILPAPTDPEPMRRRLVRSLDKLGLGHDDSALQDGVADRSPPAT